MAKCPNCGQRTVRTGDWACQWCGYPLLSGSYKQTEKTYKQLQDERMPNRELPVGEETEPALELEPEPEFEAELIPEPEAEPVPELKAEPILEPELEPALETEVESAPQPEVESEPVAELKTEPISELAPEPGPAALKVTVEEMLSAYGAEGEAADAKFANKILRVTGVVDRIEVKHMLDIHYITLTSAEKNLLQNVRCMFDRQYVAELSQLTTGQTVTVQGKYDGSIINMRMRDCVLVR